MVLLRFRTDRLLAVSSSFAHLTTFDVLLVELHARHPSTFVLLPFREVSLRTSRELAPRLGGTPQSIRPPPLLAFGSTQKNLREDEICYALEWPKHRAPRCYEPSLTAYEVALPQLGDIVVRK